MAGLVHDLIQTLTEEENVYEELLILATEKTNTIRTNNMELLQKITAAETAIIGRGQRLENKREFTVKNIGVVLNKKPEDLTLTVIADIINNPEDSLQILELRDRLKGILEALKEKNAQNKILLEGALDYIEFSVNLMRDAISDTHPEDTMKNNFFDAKQ